MKDNDEYMYDLFISYRWITPDQEWVREQLYPALLDAGLKVCLDVEDFVPGRDLILEMERAGHESRHVLCVISPQYFEAGRMVEFESLSARRRDPAGRQSSLIPLILRETEIPERIRGLIPIYWTTSKDHAREWKKLLRVLGAKDLNAPYPSSLQTVTQKLLDPPALNAVTPPTEPNFQSATIRQPARPTIPPALTTCSNNLPAQPTPLIGRTHEITEVLEMYQRGARLVTLIGPGGIGKTHLSLQIGVELLGDCADGVYFIDLASLEEHDLITQTIIQALNIRPASDQPISVALSRYLQDKRMLLILDSFERVVAAAPFIADLLSASPELKLLITSRKSLNLRGEQEYPIPPLELPPTNPLPQFDILLRYPAIELFVSRVRATKPDFQVITDEAPVIAEICARLDGLPLAIELAAARMKVLSPRALLTRLEDRLALLTGGSVDLPLRQQTLRGTIDWSYELLTDSEKKLFRRISVFTGGFSLEAAEAVCNDVAAPEDGVLDGITALLNSSLLRQTTLDNSEIRFLMLQTIHEYASERLADSDELQILLQGCAKYVARMVEQENFTSENQQSSLRRVDIELDNIRAVLNWCKEDKGDPIIGLKISTDLWLYWEMRGFMAEGRKHIEDLLARSINQAPKSQRAIAMLVAGNLASSQGDSKGARPLYEESLALHKDIGDRMHVAGCLTGLGNIARVDGDYLKARTLYEEGLAIKQELGEVWGSAVQFHNLARVAYQLGELTEACKLFEKSLAIARSINDKRIISRSLAGLGDVYLDKGDQATARSIFQESIKTAQALEDRLSILLPILRFSTLIFEEGDANKSALILAAAYALREAVGANLSPTEEKKMDDLKTRMCERLGGKVFRDAWISGQKLSLDQIASVVLDDSGNK